MAVNLPADAEAKALTYSVSLAATGSSTVKAKIALTVKPDSCDHFIPFADLAGCKLIKANLTGDDLTGANLNGTDLLKADLNGAILVGASLGGANLS